MDVSNIVKFQDSRQKKDNFHLTYQRKLQVTENFVKRLGLETELEGHSGCVNCLQWNDAGDLLASGSDDLNIVLWRPFQSKQLHKFHTIQTGHHGNIFSVKFVPGTNDRCIVSGAADFKIKVSDYTSNEVTFNCCCHGGRVKRLATAANIPNMFWSAAEDGMIMQFDLRTPHQCSNIRKNVLVNLVNHLGRTAEAKCLTINPVNTDLIAVGANDPYVRMYDRRMIKVTTAKFSSGSDSSYWQEAYSGEPVEPGDDNLPPGCVSYFVAGHLPLKQNDFKRRYRSLTSTYVTFSPDGKDLLANLGGEQIYLFNIASKRKQLVFNMSEKALNFNFNAKECRDSLKMDCCEEYCSSRNGTNGMGTNGVNHSASCLHNSKNSPSPAVQQKYVEKRTAHVCPPEISEIRTRASTAFDEEDYNKAISLYSTGIGLSPKAACLYGNRAAAYINRGWDGDYYAAVRDCYAALEMEPNYLKAHFRLAQCLHKLRWAKEAYDCLEAFKIRFPQYAKTKVFEAFENDVKMSIFAEMSRKSKSTNQSTQTSTEAFMAASERDFTDMSDNESEDDASSPFFGSFIPISFDHLPNGVSDQEKTWRSSAFDYEFRYCGHCNTTTDIKEANFFGGYGEFIIAGSDDGSIFIWDRRTTNIVRVLRGDDSIVNCLQPHPSTCMLATSGIDPVVRLWTPRAEDGSTDEREILNQDDAAFANQRRMNADPLEIMLLNMGYRLPGVLEQMSDDLDSRPGSDRNAVQCRTS